MQKEYIDLPLKDKQLQASGKFYLAVFSIKPKSGKKILDVASEVAAESSTGTNMRVGTATKFSDSLDALVYHVSEKQGLVWIAYPWRIFDRGGNIQNIMTYVAGNIFGMSEVTGLRLLDVWFPASFLKNYDGPSYTLDNLRSYLKVYSRPILGTIIKPKIGLKPKEYAKACYDFWSGGGDFVKNDEPQADQEFCPFQATVKEVRKAMDKAEKETGQKKIHSFNISAADFDTMIKRAEFVKKNMKPGSFGFLVDGITAGWTAVQTIRRHYPNVFLHFHRAGHGALTRPEDHLGYTVLVLSKHARLAGASGLHTGTAGVGKMKGEVGEDIVSAQMILRQKAYGHFFEQDWGQMKKVCPIISGGLNPLKLVPFIKAFGGVDFITTMGGGVHSHPGGTKSGARALVQACEAYKKGKTVEQYAVNHPELAVAIKFFRKK